MCLGREHREDKGKPYSSKNADANQITCFFRRVLKGREKKLEEYAGAERKEWLTNTNLAGIF